jgi:hypothetical protein
MLVWCSVVVALLGVASCNSGKHNGEEVYDLSEYQRFKRFDIFSLKGVFPVISEVDTPFVYVKQAGDSILIRKSKHPEKLTVVRNRGKFWTLRSKPTEDLVPSERAIIDQVMYWATLPDTVMWISYCSVNDYNMSTIGAFSNNFRISKEVPLSKKAYSVAEIDSFIAEMRRSIPIFLQKHEGESYSDYEDVDVVNFINYSEPPQFYKVCEASGALIDIFHIPTALPSSLIDASYEEDFFCVTHHSYATCQADSD